jgi:hypothetical protein
MKILFFIIGVTGLFSILFAACKGFAVQEVCLVLGILGAIQLVIALIGGSIYSYRDERKRFMLSEQNNKQSANIATEPKPLTELMKAIRFWFVIMASLAICTNLAAWIFIAPPFVISTASMKNPNLHLHYGGVAFWGWFLGLVLLKFLSKRTPRQDRKLLLTRIMVWTVFAFLLTSLVYFKLAYRAVDAEIRHALLAMGVGFLSVSWLWLILMLFAFLRGAVLRSKQQNPVPSE